MSSLTNEQIKKMIDDKRTIVLNNSEYSSKLYKYISGDKLVYDTYVIKEPNTSNTAQIYYNDNKLTLEAPTTTIQGSLNILGGVSLDSLLANSTTFGGQLRVVEGGIVVSGNATFNNSVTIGSLGHINTSMNEFNIETHNNTPLDKVINIGSNDFTNIINIGCTNNHLKEINIGSAGNGTTIINIGSLGDIVNINATANYISMNDLNIANKNIILNSISGSPQYINSSGSGIYISDGITISAGYIITDPLKGEDFVFKTPSSSYIIKTPKLFDNSTLIVENNTSKVTNLNNLNISGNTLVNSLFVSGSGIFVSTNATFVNDVSISNSFVVSKNEVSISGSLSITGNVTMYNNLYVEKELTINNTFISNKNSYFHNATVSISGNLNISGDTNIQNIYVKNNAIFDNANVLINGNLEISGNPDILGNLNVSGNTNISGDTYFTKDVYVDNNARINNRLFVSREATFNNSINVSGGLFISNRGLIVTGNSTFSNIVQINNSAIINNDLTVNRNVGFNNSNVTISGGIFLSGRGLIVTGNSTFSNNITISGNTTINSDLNVNRNVGFNNSILTISGGIFLSGRGLIVTGNSTFSNNLFVNNNARINNQLFVLRDSTFNSNINVSGGIFVSGRGIVITGNGTISNNLEINNNVDVMNELTVQKDVYFNNSILNLNGGLKMNAMNGFLITGNGTFNNSNISINGELGVSGNISNNGLKTLGDLALTGNVYVNSLDTKFNSNEISISSNNSKFYGNMFLNNNLILNNTIKTINSTFSPNNNNKLFFCKNTTISNDSKWVAFSAIIENKFAGVILVNTYTLDIQYLQNDRNYTLTFGNQININIFLEFETNTKLNIYTVYGSSNLECHTNLINGIWSDLITSNSEVQSNSSLLQNIINTQTNYYDNKFIVSKLSNDAIPIPIIQTSLMGFYCSGTSFIENNSELVFKCEEGPIGKIYANQNINNNFNIETLLKDTVFNVCCEENVKEINIGANTIRNKIITIGSDNDSVVIKGVLSTNTQTETNLNNVTINGPYLTLNKPSELGTIKQNTRGIGLYLSDGIKENAGYIITSSFNGDHFVFKAFTGPFSAPNDKCFELYTPVISTTSTLLSKDNLTETLNIKNINVSGILDIGVLRNYGGLTSTGTSNFNTVNINTIGNINRLNVTNNATFRGNVSIENLSISGSVTFGSQITFPNNFFMSNASINTLNTTNTIVRNLNVSGTFISTGNSLLDNITTSRFIGLQNATFQNSLAIGGSLSITGNLIVTGSSTFNNVNLNNITVNNNVTLRGSTNISATFTVTGLLRSNNATIVNSTFTNVSSNTISSTNNNFVNLNVNNNATFNSNLYSNNIILNNNATFNNLVSINKLNVINDATFNSNINIGSFGSINSNTINKSIHIENKEIDGIIQIGSNDNIVNIGNKTNSYVNIGGNNNTVKLSGDIVYEGTIQADDLTIMNSVVQNKTITLNTSNIPITPTDSGIIISNGDGLGTNIGYIKTDESNATYYKIKAPQNNYILNTPVLSSDATIITKDSNNLVQLEKINILADSTFNNATINSLKCQDITLSNNLVSNNLFVTTISTFNNNVFMANGLITNNNVTFNSEVFSNRLIVSGNSTFNSNINVSGNINSDTLFTKNLIVNDNSIFNSSVTINGTFNISGAINITSLQLDTISTNKSFIETINTTSINVYNGMNVTGVSTFNSNLNILGNLNVSNDSNFTNILTKDLTILNNVTFNNTISISSLNVNNSLISNDLYIQTNGYINNKKIITDETISDYTIRINYLTLDGETIEYNNIHGNQVFLIENSIPNYVENMSIHITGSCNTVATNGDIVYIGGSFIGTSGINNLARCDTSDKENLLWSSFGSVNGRVNTIHVHENELYIGGTFNAINGSLFSSIALYKNDTWYNLGNGINGIVNTIVSKDNMIYVGGTFTSVNTIPMNSIAKWDIIDNQWYSIGNVNGIVCAMAIGRDNILYVGGTFTNINGNSMYGIATLDITNNLWEPIGNVDGLIHTIEVDRNNIVYLGGSFINVSGISTKGIIKYHNGLWDTLGNGIDGTVKSMKFDVIQKNLYIVSNINNDSILYSLNTETLELNEMIFSGTQQISGSLNTITSDTKNNFYIGGSNLLGIGDLIPNTVKNIMKIGTNYIKPIIFDKTISFIDKKYNLQTSNSYELSRLGEQVNIYFNKNNENGYVLTKSVIENGGDNIDLTQSMTFLNDVNIKGDLILSSGLSVENTVTFNNALTVYGNTNFYNNFNLFGNATMNNVFILNKLDVSGNSNLEIINNKKINSVEISVNFLNVTNSTNLIGNVNMSNNLTVSNNIVVSGTSFLKNANVYDSFNLGGINSTYTFDVFSSNSRFYNNGNMNVLLKSPNDTTLKIDSSFLSKIDFLNNGLEKGQILYDNLSSLFKLLNNNIEGLTINTSGFVNIGNSESNSKLNICDYDGSNDINSYGIAQIVTRNSNVNTQPALSFVRNNSSVLCLGYNDNTNIFGFGLSNRTIGGTYTTFIPQLLSINNDTKNVGIGTINANNTLHVSTNTNGNGLRLDGGTNGPNNGGGLEFGISSSDSAQPMAIIKGALGFWLNSGNNNQYQGGIDFQTRPVSTTIPQDLQSRMFIANNGNIGIGITNPLSRLSISQVLSQNNTPNQIIGEISFQGFNRTVKSSYIQCISQSTDNLGGLAFATNNGTGATEKMRILENGNVGIGVTTPTEKLDINGSIKVSNSILSPQFNCQQLLNDTNLTFPHNTPSFNYGGGTLKVEFSSYLYSNLNSTNYTITFSLFNSSNSILTSVTRNLVFSTAGIQQHYHVPFVFSKVPPGNGYYIQINRSSTNLLNNQSSANLVITELPF